MAVVRDQPIASALRYPVTARSLGVDRAPLVDRTVRMEGLPRNRVDQLIDCFK